MGFKILKKGVKLKSKPAKPKKKPAPAWGIIGHKMITNAKGEKVAIPFEGPLTR